MLNDKKIIAARKNVQQRDIQVTAPIIDVGPKESLPISHHERSRSGEWKLEDRSLAGEERASYF